MTETAPPPAHRLSPPPALLGALALMALAVAVALSQTHVRSPNDASRFGAMLSLGLDGSYALHPSMAWSIDRALRDDGVFISDKPPMQNLIGGGIVWVVVRVPPFNDGVSSALLYRISTLALSTLPALIALALIARLARRLGQPTGLVVALAALTTLLTVQATTLSNQTASAMLVLLTALALHTTLTRGGAARTFALGLAAGVVIWVDVPTGLVISGVTAGLMLRWNLRGSVPLIAGLLFACAVGGLLNQITAHRWLPAYFQSDMYDYAGSVFFEIPEDLPVYPLRSLQRMVVMLIGGHGLLWMWPVGLFALAGCIRVARGEADPAKRRLAVWTLALTFALLGALILNPGVRGADIGSAFGYGFRWAIPVMGPLLLFLPDALRDDRPRRLVALWLCTGWSAVIVALGLLNPWPSITMSRFPPVENTVVSLAQLSPSFAPLATWVVETTAREEAIGHFDHAMIHFHRGRHRLAADLFERALETPEGGETHLFDPALCRYHLGICLTELGRWEEVDINYEALLALDPGNLGARNNWALALLAQGEAERARDLADAVLMQDPTNASATEILIRASAMMGDLERASALLREALARSPENPRLRALESALP